MKSVQMAVILKNNQMTDTIYNMVVLAPQIAQNAAAGQFVNLYTGRGEYLLPRPISICEIDKQNGTLRFVYQVVGKGTDIFSKLKEDDKIKILGPLGNGFLLQDTACSILIGGGIGVPPLLQLAKEIPQDKFVFIGARTEPILVEEFKAIGAKVFVATDSGKEGFHGNVMELIQSENPPLGSVYACGPRVMLQAVSKWAQQNQMTAQISMEERMACGIGACVGCAIKVKKPEQEDWQNLKVCKDGPVFFSNEVVWNE